MVDAVSLHSIDKRFGVDPFYPNISETHRIGNDGGGDGGGGAVLERVVMAGGGGGSRLFQLIQKINSQSVVHVAHSSSRNLPCHTIAILLYHYKL